LIENGQIVRVIFPTRRKQRMPLRYDYERWIGSASVRDTPAAVRVFQGDMHEWVKTLRPKATREIHAATLHTGSTENISSDTTL
jgi:hypothetical protein